MVDKTTWMDINIFPFRGYSTDERERMFELYTDAVKRGIITEITAPQLKKLREQGTSPAQCGVAEEILWFEQEHEIDDHAAQHFIDNEISSAIDNLKYFDFERNYLLHKDKVYSTESEFVGLYAHLFKDLLKRQSSEIIELYMTTDLYLSFFHEHLRFLRFVFEESRPSGMKPSGTLQRLFFEHGKDSVREPAKMLSYYLKNPRVEDEDAYLVSYIESQGDSSTRVDLESSDTRDVNVNETNESDNHELFVAHNMIKKLRADKIQLEKINQKKKYYQLEDITKEKWRELIDQNHHKSSKKPNYSAIASKIGCRSGETVRDQIDRKGLSNYIPT